MVNDSFRSDDGAFQPRQDAQNFVSSMRDVWSSGVGTKHVVLRDKDGRQLIDVPMTYALIGGLAGLFLAPMLTLGICGVSYVLGYRLSVYDGTTR